MSSKEKMISVAVGIVMGVILAILYNYMASSRENLDITNVPDKVPDIPSISPEEKEAILDGDWSDFKDWIDKNIKEPDDDYIKRWQKVDEELEKELTQDDNTGKSSGDQ